MNDDPAADRHAASDRHRLSGIGVNDAVVLDIRILAYGDPVVIAPDNSAEPDACILSESDLTDQNGIGRNPVFAFRGQYRLQSVQRINRHSNISLLEKYLRIG